MSGVASAGEHVAFGFRLQGVPPRGLTRADQPRWPVLHVHREIGPPQIERSHLGASRAQLALGAGDWLALDRDARTATYLTRAPLDEDALIHPRLAPAAALMGRWLGREAFHAGALLIEDGAWALAGTNEAGKSTILATLAMRGQAVLTDDLLVVDRTAVAYAGARCIDLRRPHGIADLADEQLRAVRDGSRQRMDLGAVAPAAPLRGWFHLEWGSRVEAVPCSASMRLHRLMGQRRWATQTIDPRVLLELASLPAWTLHRPRGAQHMDAVLDLLQATAAGARPRAPRRAPAPAV